MTVVDDLATALVTVAALLAMGSGAAKLVSPTAAVQAMRAVGLPSNLSAVRLGALTELGVGSAVLVAASWVPKVLLVAMYLCFAVFSVASMRARSTAPCGCFGASGGSVTSRHLIVSLLLAVAGALALRAGSSSLIASIHAASPSGVAVLVVAGVAAMLAATALSRPAPG